MSRQVDLQCPECGSPNVVMEHNGVVDLVRCRDCNHRFASEEADDFEKSDTRRTRRHHEDDE